MQVQHTTANLPNIDRSLDADMRLRRLATAATLMLIWLFIWALVLKLGSEILLVRNYTNLKDMTFRERIEWDLIPFNYRGTEYWQMRQRIDTLLNCLIFVPFGITLPCIWKKRTVLRGAAFCFGFVTFIELAQLLTMLGNPATEDFITNTFSFFVGCALYRLVFRRLSEKGSVRLFRCANAVLLLMTVFSIVTTVGSAEVIYKIVTRTL